MKRYFLVILLFVLVFPRISLNSNEFEYRNFTSEEIGSMKESIGVYDKQKNYNTIVDGFGTGFAPPAEGWYEKLFEEGKIRLSSGVKAPATHDNSTSIHFPPVGNQKAEGSCTAWAAVYYSRTFLKAQEKNWDFTTASWDTTNNQPQPSDFRGKTFSPDFVYHQINGGGDNGSWSGDASELMEQIGVCTWEKMPYDDTDSITWPNEAAWRNAPQFRTGQDYWIYIDNSGISTMKQVLSENKLIVIAMDAYQYPNLDSNDLFTADNYNSSVTNHANTIVGYDDNYGPYTENSQQRYGAFKVVNSWGTGTWENVADGFYWISYEAIKKLAYEWGHYFVDRINYQPKFIAVLNISHNARGDLIRKFARVGGLQKSFDEIHYRGGANAHPAHDIVLDITDIMGTGISNTYEFRIRDLANGEKYPNSNADAGTHTTGTVNKFCIEDYSVPGSDYDNQIPGSLFCSADSPKNTVNGSTQILSVLVQGNPQIEGYITDGEYPIPGVTVNLTGDSITSTVTTNTGYYFIRGLQIGSNYTITPSLTNWSFSPASADYSSLDGDKTQNFTGKKAFANNLDNVTAFPNPCINAPIIFDNLSNGSVISIYSISGNLIKGIITQGGEYKWNLKNEKGSRIASGVYLCVISNAQTSKIIKIAVK